MAVNRKRTVARKMARLRNATPYQQPAPRGTGGTTTRTPIAPSRAHPEAPPYRPYIT